jgi:hypothetical protein
MDLSHKISVIFDNNGSVFIGHILSDTPDYYLIYNPAQVFYNVNSETKEVEINMIPVCFPELLSEETKVKGTRWTYKKSNAKFVSADDINLDPRVVQFYVNIFTRNSQ